MTEAGAAARRYLRRHHAGVLSTVSKNLEGYPFGSVVPFVLDHEACPLMLVSRLAEHTRNIDGDPRASLLVRDHSDDVQAGARLTLVGDAERAAGNLGALQARYLGHFPEAAKLLALGDFTLYRIRPRQLRWIGGFGDIRWIAADDFRPPASRLAEQEPQILEHMNADHAHNLRDYCLHAHGRTPQDVRMAGIDCDGFDVRADGELLRFEFDAPAADAAAARAALVALSHKARAT